MNLEKLKFIGFILPFTIKWQLRNFYIQIQITVLPELKIALFVSAILSIPEPVEIHRFTESLI